MAVPKSGVNDAAPLQTAAELETKLGIPLRSIYLLVESGELPHYRIGRRVRFAQHHIDAFLAKREVAS